MSNSTLTLIYLIYGLSFLGMSLGITVSLRRTGKIRLLTGFHWLALFGLVHGLHEWVDLVFLLWGPLHPALELLDALVAARAGNRGDDEIGYAVMRNEGSQ